MANMLNKIMFVSLVCWAVTSLANTNDTIRTYETEGLDALALTSTTQIETLKATSIRTQSEHKSLIDNLMQNAKSGLQGMQKPQAADGAVLFVSFSMPDSLLFALADEAALFNIPVVINGLVEGDFKKTIETFKRLHTEAKKQQFNFKGVSIDPVWFAQFQIKSVPALVVTEPPKTCAIASDCDNQPFDVVYGNASLRKALELIAKKGDVVADRARTILERGHD
ncbi:putative conjugative transfer protein TrbC [Legionella drozanskii LLAP-1]|uniref:Putative conjugative transfer protein TrbC n=2 Tax=Legionella drozanskii TaxID=96228 RepID=A0A0W0SWH3_9GAMM|nr:putative conjugative transfer protein TrbC [Legionella drozanskii LLAP-1]